jgi:DnaK suppressor protein
VEVEVEVNGLADEVERTGRLVADLRTELAGIAESTAGGPDDEHDAEGSTVGYERARVTGLLERALLRLEELAAASAAVAAGTYGCCERCGGAIGAERQEALPATRCCVGCASYA